MKNWREKKCQICDRAFKPTGPAAKYCAPCWTAKERQRGRVKSARQRRENPEAPREAVRRWYEKTKMSRKQINWRKALLRNYGLTIDQYVLQYEDQGGKCAICSKTPGRKRLSVDHCHTTGITRGLLCSSCNFGLGRFKDNVDSLRAAIAYLEKHATIVGVLE